MLLLTVSGESEMKSHDIADAQIAVVQKQVELRAPLAESFFK